MSKPDFFLVGAPRSGTTALYTYLKSHPEIFMSPIKETQFFAADLLGEHRPIRTWAEYLNCFSGAQSEKRIGEASALYLSSRSAPAAIKAFCATARIIVILRNPVDMMYSLYCLHRASNRERHASFEAALAADEAGEIAAHGLGYREIARYATQIERYFQNFGRTNVHVMTYDDFRGDTRKAYEDTLRFLDVSQDSRSDFPVVHANYRVRSGKVMGLVQQPPRLMRAAIRSIIPRRLRSLAGNALRQLNITHEARLPMSPQLKRRLQKEFHSEVEQLGRLLGRDLSAWVET